MFVKRDFYNFYIVLLYYKKISCDRVCLKEAIDKMIVFLRNKYHLRLMWNIRKKNSIMGGSRNVVCVTKSEIKRMRIKI